MINFLNESLRQLLMTRIKEDILEVSQVSFEFPDEEFRNQVKTLGKNVLNVSLVDLRENRTTALAGTAGPRVWPGNTSPRRVDCHYLITAWSPATRNAEPSLDEHLLLYKALAALMDAEPLVPSRIYGSKPMPKNFPSMLRDVELPTVILPVERFPRIAEFWLATKSNLWKPTIHLVVTLPMVSDEQAPRFGFRRR